MTSESVTTCSWRRDPPAPSSEWSWAGETWSLVTFLCARVCIYRTGIVYVCVLAGSDFSVLVVRLSIETVRP